VITISTGNSLEGIPGFLAHRVAGWVHDGMDERRLIEVLRTLGAQAKPGSAVYVVPLMNVADRWFTEGQRELEPQKKHDAFLEASFYYFLARFPHVLSPLAEDAYRKSLEAYAQMGACFDPPLETVRIPYGTGTIVGYLRRPKGLEHPPVVMLWGGIDVWKGDLELHRISDGLLSQGLATFSLDMPGTGESPVVTGPHAERMFIAALEHLKRRPELGGERIGAYGLSFGGHWATKLALQGAGLKAVVNVGGPVHSSFQADWVERLPVGTLMALAKIQGVSFQEIGARGVGEGLGRLSLLDQGLLRSNPHQAAILSINGSLDELVTIDDLYVLYRHGIAQDTLVFAGDRHVASRNAGLHQPFAARWLAARLASRSTTE
jgi:esterase FrsA